MILRIAYDERTRAPVEVVRRRALRWLYEDLVALDILDRAAEAVMPKPEAKR